MRSHSKALFAVAALFAVLVLAPHAQAAPRDFLCQITASETPSVAECNGIGSAVPGGAMNEPSGIAVDPLGNIWVGEDRFGSNRILKFDGAGNYLAQLDQSGFPPRDNSGVIPVFRSITYGKARNKAYVINTPGPELWVLNPDASVDSVIESFPKAGELFCCDVWVAVDNSESATDGSILVATDEFLSAPPHEKSVTRLDANGDPSDFSSAGLAPYITGNQITGTPDHPFGTLGGITVGPDGDIYVIDLSNAEVDRFDASGEFVRKYTGFGSASGVAVDPTNDNVLIADPNQGVVHEFDSLGTLVRDIDGLATPIGSMAPDGIAVDPNGRLIVTDPANNVVNVFDRDSIRPRVTYEPVSEETPTSAVLNGSVDPNGGGDVTECYFEYGATEAYGSVVPCSPPIPPDYSTPTPVSAELTGLTPETTYHYRLVATGAGGTRFGVDRILTPHHVAALRTEPATDLTGTSATLNGSFTGEGLQTSYYFEYGTTTTYGQTVPAPPGADAGNGTDHQALSLPLTGLQDETTYHYRVVASNSSGTSKAENRSFKTLPLPEIEALDPGPITATTAWLGAYVNPRKIPTTFYVEYSTDPNFASSVTTEDASIGSGGELALANQLVEGLQPATTYHYQVVGSSQAGTTTGDSRSFTTTAAPTGPPATELPDGRVWEKVSPSNKAGANINAGNYMAVPVARERSQAATDGDAVAFGSDGKFAGAEGAPATSQYLARRGANGWSTEAVNPPMDPSLGLTTNKNYFRWFSDDLSKGAVTTPAALNLGDPEGVYNLYLRDNNARTHTTISDADDSTEKGSQADLGAVSEDEEHFVYQIYDSSETEPASVLMERDLGTGEVRQVSVLPDDSIVPAKLGSGNSGYMLGFNSVSANGSRIFFSARHGLFESVYVRENGTSTELLSASERVGDDPNAPVEGEFVGASKDGSVAFFRSPKRLTDDTLAPESPDCGSGDACYLYRWDADEPAGERLANISLGDPAGANVLGLVGLSDDGRSAYFVAQGDLDGNGSPKEPNLYLWREGEGVRFVAWLVDRDQAGEHQSDWSLWDRHIQLIEVDTNGTTSDEPYKGARVTPDGRYLAFSSRVAQTAYDTDGNRAVYIYDSETGRTTCVSCGTVSAKSKGHSWFVSCGAEDGPGGGETRCGATPYLTHNFRSDGKRLIFDSKDALLPHDTNGVTDVYEWQGGELHLLSSGTSAFPSRFVDASEDGDDVFFTTAQRLTQSDKDELRDLYDARVGGMPEPNLTPPCVADECQDTPAPPPSFQTPSSAGFKGDGNASQGRPRCGKAKVRRKGRCVKRKASKRANGAKNKRADQDRRAGR